MSTAPQSCLTSEEYLLLERRAEFRSELVRGEMFAMAGGTSNHATGAANIVAALRPKLRGKSCFVYGSDMKVFIPHFAEFTYPDVSVVCGERQFRDNTQDVLLNPALIVEVLSSSTADYDRGEKFTKYREIPSFQEYLLVAQDRIQIEHYLRLSADQWHLTIYTRLEQTLSLPCLALEIPLQDVYEDIQFPT